MFKGNYIRVNEYDIYYCIFGKGPHVVLFLDGSVSHFGFGNKFQIENYDLEKFTIVLWDYPGMGNSRPLIEDFSIDYDFINAEYAFQLMKALKFTTYSVWGKCSGGAASMILAAKYPEVVKVLVVSNAKSYFSQAEFEKMKSTLDFETWSPKVLQSRIEVYGLEVFTTLWKKWDVYVEKILIERNGNICTHLLGDIKCPTLILTGGKDPKVDNGHAQYCNVSSWVPVLPSPC